MVWITAKRLWGHHLGCVPGQEERTFRDLFYEEHGRHPDQEEHNIRFPPGTKLKVPGHPGCPADGFALEGIGFTVKDNPPMTEMMTITVTAHT